MNIDRLRQIIADVRRDLEVTRLEPQLTEIEAALQQQINQPNQPSFQKRVDDLLSILTETLASAPSNAEGPVWWHLVGELNLTDILPQSVTQEIDEVLSRRLMPVLALEQVREVRARVAQKRERIDNIAAGLEYLNVEKHPVPAGEAELSILVPRNAVHNRLQDFGDEARELSNLLNDIIVAGTGEPEELRIQSLSTSEILVDLRTASEAVLNFAKALGIIAASYVAILRLHRSADTFVAEGAPDEDVQKIVDGLAKKQLTKAVNDATKALLDGSNATKTEKNDRRARTKLALRKLIDRLGKGYSFDVQPSDDDMVDGDEGENHDATSNIAHQIVALRKNIQQYLGARDTRMLQLPPGDDDSDGDNDDSAPDEPASPVMT